MAGLVGRLIRVLLIAAVALGTVFLAVIGAAPASAVVAVSTYDAAAYVYDVTVRTAGAAGEQAAGIIKNTQRIPSLSGTASYRIPDELASTALGEVPWREAAVRLAPKQARRG